MPTGSSRRALLLAAVLGTAVSLAALLRRARGAARTRATGKTVIGGDVWPPVPGNSTKRRN